MITLLTAVTVLLASADPALEIIAEAYEQSGQPFVIINEDHDVDYHRHVSACLLDRIAVQTPVIFGAEALSPSRDTSDLDRLMSTVSGYAGSRYYRDIWRVAERRGLTVFGYDPVRADFLTDEALRARGLSHRVPNRRDSLAAERILEQHALHPDQGVYLHVGHAHVYERWSVTDDGRATGWLAAHIRHQSGADPVTVHQMNQEDRLRYEQRGVLIFNAEACAAITHATALLRLGDGEVGCVERHRNAHFPDVDFIVLHDINPGDASPRASTLCQTR